MTRTGRDKRGKYGRYIVEIIDRGGNVNIAPVDEGLAVFTEYKF